MKLLILSLPLTAVTNAARLSPKPPAVATAARLLERPLPSSPTVQRVLRGGERRPIFVAVHESMHSCTRLGELVGSRHLSLIAVQQLPSALAGVHGTALTRNAAQQAPHAVASACTAVPSETDVAGPSWLWPLSLERQIGYRLILFTCGFCFNFYSESHR